MLTHGGSVAVCAALTDGLRKLRKLRKKGIANTFQFLFGDSAIVIDRGVLSQKTVDDGHYKERRKRRQQQAPDDGAAERRILFATLSEPERHRQHADDHRQRRHQYGPNARMAGGQRG